KIQAATIPQWEWSTAECQEWLFQVLIAKLNYTPEDAAITAAKLEGFGPNIYARRKEQWCEFLGEYAGAGIYFWLLGKREEKGTYPRHLELIH
ncbi:hypothetical protein B0J14DRAFT_428779, partial [Halenospora varia]